MSARTERWWERFFVFMAGAIASLIVAATIANVVDRPRRSLVIQNGHVYECVGNSECKLISQREDRP